jgi:hypothetical protein
LTSTSESFKKLEKLAAETPCAKNHECLKASLHDLTKVEVVADGKALICLSENAWQCRYATSFGRVMICTCPVRKHIPARSAQPNGNTHPSFAARADDLWSDHSHPLSCQVQRNTRDEAITVLVVCTSLLFSIRNTAAKGPLAR